MRESAREPLRSLKLPSLFLVGDVSDRELAGPDTEVLRRVCSWAIEDYRSVSDVDEWLLLGELRFTGSENLRSPK